MFKQIFNYLALYLIRLIMQHYLAWRAKYVLLIRAAGCWQNFQTFDSRGGSTTSTDQSRERLKSFSILITSHDIAFNMTNQASVLV